MLDYSQIVEQAEAAARKAERAHKKPLSIRGYDPADALGFCRRIPFLGSFVPAGWVPAEGIDDLFVDATGLDSSGPALSVQAFAQRLQAFRSSGDNYGFGIVEAGEFQVYVRVYRPDPRDFTGTGELTEQDLRRARPA